MNLIYIAYIKQINTYPEQHDLCTSIELELQLEVKFRGTLLELKIAELRTFTLLKEEKNVITIGNL